MSLILTEKSVNVVVHIIRGGMSRAVKRGLLFIVDNNRGQSLPNLRSCGVRGASHEACAGIGLFILTHKIVEVAMRSVNPTPLWSETVNSFTKLPPEHQKACWLVLTALLTHSIPCWEGVPGEVREAWQGMWEKYRISKQ